MRRTVCGPDRRWFESLSLPARRAFFLRGLANLSVCNPAFRFFPRPDSLWAAGLGVCVLLAALGCQAKGRMYRAAMLPRELMPVPQQGLRNVDLSRLATSGPPSELLHPGDLVQVTIVTGLETDEPVNWRLRLADDGTVNIPLLGPVRIGGLVPTQAEQVVHDESISRGKFVNPNVSVIMLARRSHRVTVVGAVSKPGTYDLPAHNSNVLAAIVAAEGLTEDAGTMLEIGHPAAPNWATPGGGNPPGRFPNQQASFAAGLPGTGRKVTIDLTQGPAISSDTRLEDGATVMVRPKEKRYVFVNGLVRKPDRYELPDDQDLRLLDALALAGGRTLEIADKVHVLRQVSDGGEPAVIVASVRDAKTQGSANIRLAPGDVITVEETMTTFVIGTIRDFVRFGFTSAIPGI